MNPLTDKDTLTKYLLDTAKENMTFTAEELWYFEKDIGNRTYEELMELLPTWHEEGYKYTPVPVREWILSKDYMDLENQLFPRLIDDLEELFEGDYTEAVIDGSIGWGKSYFSAVALLRMVYEASCLKNPQITYGIARGTPISFVNAAIKEKTAKEVVFKYCKNFVQNSPYFQEEYKLEKELEAELVFQDNIRLWAATSSQSGIIGQNMFGGTLDEINFFGKVENSAKVQSVGEVYDHAKVLWSSAIKRMQSRFERQGKIPGILLMVSSNMYPDDFTIWRRELAEANGEKIFHRRYSQWETKPKGFFVDGFFKVSLGNINVRPRIIRSPVEVQYDKTLDDTEALENQNIQIIDVPASYKAVFEQDIDMAVREVAGFPTLTAAPFFRDIQPIHRAVDRGRVKDLKHPFSTTTTTLLDSSTAFWKKENLDFSKKYHRHFAHVDLALTGDAAGLSVVRLDGMVERETDESLNRENIIMKRGSSEWVPHITQILSLRIISQSEKPIPIAKVRHILMDMINMGFLFSKITYDQWNSADSIQDFLNLGIESKILSVDRKMEPYEVLRNTLQDNLLDMYPGFEFLIQELSRLEIDTIKRKIDHPPKGSKDVSDTLAGAVYNAVTFALQNPTLVTYGLSEQAMPNLILFDSYEDEDMDISWLLG